ncbi:phage major tail tube protein [Pseudooceanicola sp. CBS1P-1]|uniref:Phage tail protein n=1 Tax=Pseudooceanicola albus TaxID=2692189 RepID=A0A6L7FW53_9RHOB|nr:MULTISPECIES: phage major tail tube protein [Pseudooceanicola]MBT9383333.1 phage major tail tube protein [Pseudooceanicola endophyticus]MXN16344.1 phage tail protein [Pseudooceanicola albus]
MKSTPAYILRNCALWADEDIKVGQFSSVSIQLPKATTEKFRNGGMIKERQVVMGYEVGDMTFKLTAFDPATLKLLTGKAGTEHAFMVTGAHVDEDGTTHSAVYYVRGQLIAPDAGDWQPGQKAETDCTVAVNYAKLEIDGADIFEIDDFDYSVGGVSQTGDIANALLI